MIRFWMVIVIGLQLAFGSARAADPPVRLGILQPFYRSTQLQGHLIGMGLMEIPDYLLGGGIDFVYRKKPGMSREIPFVDSFSITRFLGGYREDWLQRYNLTDPRYGERSLDYAVRRADGTLQFRPELIRKRLDPYLAAGYRPADITLSLDNVPWDLARSQSAGEWGQREPPGDVRAWSATISQFAIDLKSFLGAAADAVSFKTGVEFDEKASFDGSAQDFFAYYAATDRALHRVMPGASLSPGEFTGLGECAGATTTCVYDTAAFLRFAAANHLTVSYVPRSLHAFLSMGNPWPSAAVDRAVLSYARLPAGTIAEIHQFGLLFEPFGNKDGDDPAAMRASWEFQTLMGLWQKLHPRRVFHWGGFVEVGAMQFLNGSGFLRLILDHYLGSETMLLHPEEAGGRRGPGATESLAALFTGRGRPALIVASFSPQLSEARHAVTFELPATLTASGVRVIHYRASDNVFARIRADLAHEGNLKPEFSGCPLCLASPIQMAQDATRARAMITANWPVYQAKMQEILRWHPGEGDVTLSGHTLRAELEANELLVVELR
jgi:hypothetical protein